MPPFINWQRYIIKIRVEARQLFGAQDRLKLCRLGLGLLHLEKISRTLCVSMTQLFPWLYVVASIEHYLRHMDLIQHPSILDFAIELGDDIDFITFLRSLIAWCS